MQIVELIGIQRAGAAVAGLHLVDHKDDIVLAAELLDRFQKGLGHGVDAALALDSLKQDARDLVLADQRLQAIDILRVGIEKSLGQRGKQMMEAVLSRRGKGRQRSAVEALVKGNDIAVLRALGFCGVFARHLDGAFVRLGAGVAEKHLAHSGAGAEDLGKLGTGSGVIKVGGMLKQLCLLGDRFCPYGIAVAEGVDPDAGGHVDVFFAVIVPAQRAAALNDSDIKALVGMGDILIVG